jgi:hypothetical protein
MSGEFKTLFLGVEVLQDGGDAGIGEFPLLAAGFSAIIAARWHR